MHHGRLSGEFEAVNAVKQFGKEQPHFQPREMLAETDMWSIPVGNQLVCLTVDAKRVWILDDFFVAVAGGPCHRNPIALAEISVE